MRLYKEKQQDVTKDWALRITKDDDGVRIDAVDEKTGNNVAFLISFYNDGVVSRHTSAKGAIEAEGYDPCQHNNTWDDEGRIVID